MKSLSRVRLLTTPWTAAYQAPPSMGFSRQEYWSGVPLPSYGCVNLLATMNDATMNNGDVICAIPGYVEKKVEENKGVIDLVADYGSKALDLLEYVLFG